MEIDRPPFPKTWSDFNAVRDIVPAATSTTIETSLVPRAWPDMSGSPGMSRLKPSPLSPSTPSQIMDVVAGLSGDVPVQPRARVKGKAKSKGKAKNKGKDKRKPKPVNMGRGQMLPVPADMPQAARPQKPRRGFLNYTITSADHSVVIQVQLGNFCFRIEKTPHVLEGTPNDCWTMLGIQETWNRTIARSGFC